MCAPEGDVGRDHTICWVLLRGVGRSVGFGVNRLSGDFPSLVSGLGALTCVNTAAPCVFLESPCSCVVEREREYFFKHVVDLKDVCRGQVPKLVRQPDQ